MSKSSLADLKNILDPVNDLSIADDKANAHESFIEQSRENITNMCSPKDDFFEGRKRLALDDLQNHSARHLKGYWQEKDKTDKISEFSRAHIETSQAIKNIVSRFKK